MSIESPFITRVGNPPQSRRGFLQQVAAWSAVGVGSAAGAPYTLRAADLSSPPDINPGLVGPQYFDEAERQALMEVLDAGAPFRYWGREEPVKVRRFEEAFARTMGVPFALGVTSGTAALDCAMTGLGIGPGDEVIVPAYTWWSDYTCVVHAGALPVFADIDQTLNIDPIDFERRITPRTKAVIAVHLLGGPCDMEPILKVAKAHGIAVLEDAAQCVGGSYHGRKLGSLGQVGIYSFQVNKMITAGEGGAVVSSDPLIYERAVRFHDMGSLRSLFRDRMGREQVEQFAGENFRMSEFTGAVLGAQLPKLDTMITEMRGHADAITQGIRDLPGIRFRKQPDPDGDIGYGVFLEMSSREERDRVIRQLRERQVPASTLTGSVLLLIQKSVIEKRMRDPRWPVYLSPEGRAIQYGPDTCRQTLTIFDRFVQVRAGPKYTARIDDYIVESIRAVWRG